MTRAAQAPTLSRSFTLPAVRNGQDETLAVRGGVAIGSSRAGTAEGLGRLMAVASMLFLGTQQSTGLTV